MCLQVCPLWQSNRTVLLICASVVSNRVVALLQLCGLLTRGEQNVKSWFSCDSTIAERKLVLRWNRLSLPLVHYTMQDWARNRLEGFPRLGFGHGKSRNTASNVHIYGAWSLLINRLLLAVHLFYWFIFNCPALVEDFLEDTHILLDSVWGCSARWTVERETEEGINSEQCLNVAVHVNHHWWSIGT